MADLEFIRQEIEKNGLQFSQHALGRMSQRQIFRKGLEYAILFGEVIEDYPNDKYSPSCLIMGYTEQKRPLHIHVSYINIAKVITVYEPSLQDWETDLKTRKK
jgi:hypothetical protein